MQLNLKQVLEADPDVAGEYLSAIYAWEAVGAPLIRVVCQTPFFFWFTHLHNIQDSVGFHDLPSSYEYSCGGRRSSPKSTARIKASPLSSPRVSDDEGTKVPLRTPVHIKQEGANSHRENRKPEQTVGNYTPRSQDSASTLEYDTDAGSKRVSELDRFPSPTSSPFFDGNDLEDFEEQANPPPPVPETTTTMTNCI